MNTGFHPLTNILSKKLLTILYIAIYNIICVTVLADWLKRRGVAQLG